MPPHGSPPYTRFQDINAWVRACQTDMETKADVLRESMRHDRLESIATENADMSNTLVYKEQDLYNKECCLIDGIRIIRHLLDQALPRVGTARTELLAELEKERGRAEAGSELHDVLAKKIENFKSDEIQHEKYKKKVSKMIKDLTYTADSESH